MWLPSLSSILQGEATGEGKTTSNINLVMSIHYMWILL